MVDGSLAFGLTSGLPQKSGQEKLMIIRWRLLAKVRSKLRARQMALPRYPHDTAETDMAGGRVNHLGLTRRRTVAQTVVGRAQV